MQRTAHIKAISALIKADADLNNQTRRGRTALMWAVCSGRIKAVSALIQAGADLDCVNSDGLNADALAVKHGHTQIVEMLRAAREQKVVAATPDAPRA